MTTYPSENPLQTALRELVAKKLRFLWRHRERYLRAWVAATGIHPEDAMLVEEQMPMVDGAIRVNVYVVPRRQGALQNGPKESSSGPGQPRGRDWVPVNGGGERR